MLELTEEELMIEFLEDVIEVDPQEEFGREENVAFVTGDPVIDQWERELAEGKIPDFTAGLEDPEAKKDYERLLKFSAKNSPVTVSPKDDIEEEVINKKY